MRAGREVNNSKTLQGCLVDVLTLAQVPHAVDAAQEAAAAVRAETVTCQIPCRVA